MWKKAFLPDWSICRTTSTKCRAVINASWKGGTNCLLNETEQDPVELLLFYHLGSHLWKSFEIDQTDTMMSEYQTTWFWKKLLLYHINRKYIYIIAFFTLSFPCSTWKEKKHHADLNCPLVRIKKPMSWLESVG